MVVFLVCRVLAAQISNLHSQSWSTEQGLPQDSVQQVYQDSTGFVWVATEGGVARFDGVSFRVFNHANETAFASDDACCVAEDATHDLWFGTADGLIRLHDQSFTRLGEGNGLPSARIRALATDSDGSLLILTGAGLVRWRLNRFESVPQAPAEIDSMERAGPAGAWLIANGQVFLLKDGAVSQVQVLADASLKGVAGRAGDAPWTYTNSEVRSPGARPERRWRVGRELPGSRIESLFLDRGCAAWVGTNDGLAVIPKDSAGAADVPSLLGNSVLQVFEDREGNHWIGTESSGLHLLRSLAFRTQPATANKAITAVVGDAMGATWLGTRQDGLFRFQQGGVDAPAPPPALTSPVILSLAAGRDGSVWAGTPDGLNHVSAQGNTHRFTSAEGLPDDYVQALASDRDGCVWAGTRQGLAHVCESHIEVETKANGLAGDLVGTLLLARTGDLWIGTSGGLTRRSSGGQLTTYLAGRDLPAGIVTAMAEDAEGSLWIATRNTGLSRFAHGAMRHVSGEVFNADVLGMVVDGQGALWLRRERGVDRVSVKDLEVCVEKGPSCSPPVSHYGVADGLPSEEMTPTGSPALWIMGNGELWVGTRRGAGIADPAHMPHNAVAPPVAIESFVIDDVAMKTEQGPLSIPFGDHRFTIEYAGLSFVVPSKVRYRFRLDGFDREWTAAGTRRFATYTNLPARRYRFRVQAMNNDGVWNEAGATLAFRVVPPFYRRWWFIALVAVLVGAIAMGLYRIRLRSLRAQFEAVLKERNRMAREIHDTLAQDFVGVTLQLDIISQMLGMRKIDAAVAQVQQARKLVTEGLAEARQSIWELRANAATDSLPTRLGRVVERYTSDALAIRTKIGGAYRPLDRRLEAEVLRVAQEALSNVQRHSGASNASLALHYGRDLLVLTVEDEGKGFDVQQALRAQDRYGLSGLEERAHVLGATLDITSDPGKGAKITLTTQMTPRKDQAP